MSLPSQCELLVTNALIDAYRRNIAALSLDAIMHYAKFKHFKLTRKQVYNYLWCSVKRDHSLTYNRMFGTYSLPKEVMVSCGS